MSRGSAPGERRGGRQKGTRNKVGADLRAVAREYTLTGLKVVLEALEDPSVMARLRAVDMLWERGWGKAQAHIEAKITYRTAAEFSDEELADIVRSHQPNGSQPNGSGNGIAGPEGGPKVH